MAASDHRGQRCIRAAREGMSLEVERLPGAVDAAGDARSTAVHLACTLPGDPVHRILGIDIVALAPRPTPAASPASM
jgi:hypothetical protein